MPEAEQQAVAKIRQPIHSCFSAVVTGCKMEHKEEIHESKK
jgi:hypothetical protein